MSDDPPDWENISQFQSVSSAGPSSLWIATVDGNLIQISERGEKRLPSPREIVVVWFLNQRLGWAVDHKGDVWQTTDDGNSWQTISPASEPERFYVPKQLVFLDEFNGWLLGTFQLWQTTDGGKTWRERFSVSQTGEDRVGRLFRGAFVDSKHAWLASSGGVVIRTNDRGDKWQTSTPVSAGTDLHDIAFISEKKGWLVGRPNGGIYSTEDGGLTWREQQKSPQATYYDSVAFVSDREGWAVGHRYVGGAKGREGVVLHTLDGGRSWNPEPVASRERFFDRVVFFDRHHGWLVARDRVYYTDDAGKTWVVVLTLPPRATTSNPRP